MRDERRMVTALSVDVVGSVELGEQMDPEDVRDVIGGAIDLVIVAVESFGGMVADIAGDGTMCVFGAPVAHEDDAVRAILAGLRIADDVRTYGLQLMDQRGLSEFAVRIGIESGLAVLGAKGTRRQGYVRGHRRCSEHGCPTAEPSRARNRTRRRGHSPNGGATLRLERHRLFPPQGEGRSGSGIHSPSASGWDGARTGGTGGSDDRPRTGILGGCRRARATR